MSSAAGEPKVCESAGSRKVVGCEPKASEPKASEPKACEPTFFLASEACLVSFLLSSLAISFAVFADSFLAISFAAFADSFLAPDIVA